MNLSTTTDREPNFKEMINLNWKRSLPNKIPAHYAISRQMKSMQNNDLQKKSPYLRQKKISTTQLNL